MGCSRGSWEGLKREESYSLLPFLLSCPSRKGPPSWVRAQETLLGFLAVGPAAPWGLTSQEGQPPEAQSRGREDPQILALFPAIACPPARGE